MYDQFLTCCVEIHIDDPQLFPLHMELTLTARCWIKFCTWLAKVICPYNYYILFYHPSYRYTCRYYDRVLPLLRYFLLIPNRSKFMNLTANCLTPCFKEFFWYLKQFIDMQISYPKRNFTHASTLTYTTATTRMKINTVKKLRYAFYQP